MVRFSTRILAIALPTGFAAVGVARPRETIPTAAPHVTQATARNVTLRISAPGKTFISGLPIPVTATFTNRGRVMFLLSQRVPPPLVFNLMRVVNTVTGRPSGKLRNSPDPGELYASNTVASPVFSGQSAKFWEPVEVERYADMTLPGTYTVRLVAGAIRSNRLAIKITAPKRVARGTPAIVPADISRPHLNRERTRFVVTRLHWNKKRRRLEVRILQQQRDGSHPLPTVWVFLRNGGRANTSLSLTGDPFVDFRYGQLAGPDGINGDHLVAKPKPHYAPIPNWKQVPLAAYGKWLLKHPPKKMPTKRYTLKSGVVYRYAVPINLSCEYDMSLAGVYHVRVELAHPKIWSNWVNITVP